MLRLLCFGVIAPHCIVPSLWTNYKKSTSTRIRIAFHNAYRNMLVSLREVVQVQCMQITISAASRQCRERIYLVSCRD